jgi:CSLREA domain-containing protein
MTIHRWIAIAGLPLLFIVAAFLAVRPFDSSPAAAGGFVVDSTGDVPDDDPGDGVCATVGDDCTLRAAVQEASADPAPDVITLPAATYTLHYAGFDDEGGYGDLDVFGSVTIEGAGARSTIIDVNGAEIGDRGFQVMAGASLTIDGVTILNGDTAIYPSSGGAFHNAGILVIRDSTIADSVATQGGAIQNNGTLAILSSTISGNRAIAFGHGGAIYNDGAMDITNSTISGNTSEGVGGGIAGTNPSVTGLMNVTITDNHGSRGGGISSTGTVRIQNTIIASNTDDEGAPNCAANFTSLGHNLIGAPAACGGTVGSDLTDTPATLGPLANNGGPTDTHAPLAGSAAIDAGDDDACPPADQRGTPRPNGAACDIGAVESGAAPPTATPTPSSAPPPAGSTATPTPAPALLGDANGDGAIDSRDAALVLQYSAGLIVFVVFPDSWDVNRDGAVDSRDASLILQYAAGLIDTWPP